MSSIAEPVVPMKLDKIVPIRNSTIFSVVVPEKDPFIAMPPATTKSPSRRTINGIKSPATDSRSLNTASLPP